MPPELHELHEMRNAGVFEVVDQPETVAGCNQGCLALATIDGHDEAAIMWWWEVWVASQRLCD